MKRCILYYSYEGNTQFVADEMAKALNIDCFRIRPINDMNQTGLLKYVWGGKQAMMKEKPQLETFDFDLSRYDEIVVGTPIWSWTIAPAIYSLFETHLRNKKITLFYTHEGGDKNFIEKAEKIINKHNQLIHYQGFINVLKQKETTQELLNAWCQTLK